MEKALVFGNDDNKLYDFEDECSWVHSENNLSRTSFQLQRLEQVWWGNLITHQFNHETNFKLLNIHNIRTSKFTGHQK